MEQEPSLVQVNPDDIAFIEKELAASRKPATTKELAGKLAYHKTAGERTRDVKIYDPDCVYEVGDTIFKEYDEDLTVGAKAHEHFQGAVVLTVVNKAFYKDFGCEMLEVDYTGGGTFRKYVDYMKKVKTQVMLRPTRRGRADSPDHAPTAGPAPDRAADDGAGHQIAGAATAGGDGQISGVFQLGQLVAADGLSAGDHRGPDQGHWSGSGRGRRFGRDDRSRPEAFWAGTLQRSVRPPLPGRKPAARNVYKKNFISSARRLGKWMLKSVLAALPDGLPLAAPAAVLPPFESGETVPVTPFHDFPPSRSISAGGKSYRAG
jgi:hypothetical protein